MCAPCRRLKGRLWSRLRLVWVALMALTVLCVAIQILGVVRQSRSSILLRHSARENFFNMRFTIEFHKMFTPQQEGLNPSQYLQAWRQESTTENHRPDLPVARRLGNTRLFRGESSLWNFRGPKGGSPSTAQPTTSQGGPVPENKFAEEVKRRSSPQSTVGAGTTRPAQALTRPMSAFSRAEKPVETPVVTGRGHQSSTSSLLRDPWRTGRSQQRTVAWSEPESEHTVTLKRPTEHPLQRLNPGSGLNKPTPLRPANREVPSCKPKNHIMFLKTHKTASSTILNILYRYGDSRNLTFALPVNRHSQLFYPVMFAAHFVEGFQSKTVREYDIMCNHMRFVPREVKKVMPADTFYFSILRNPVSMMESIFAYYKGIPAFAKATSLDDFLNNTWRNYSFSTDGNHYAKNILSFDFGFSNVNSEYNEETHSNFIISLTEKFFDLILISEYFDESMILLKNALCWSLDDVVSFKLNSRSDKTKQKLSPQTMERIKVWNSRDWKLYLHFNATFWRKIDVTIGREAMKVEVARLRERRAELMKTCLMDGGAVDPSKVKDKGFKPFQYGSAVIQGYNLNPGLKGATRKMCQELITPELQYTAALYTKQFPELSAKLDASQKQLMSNKTTMNRSKMLEIRMHLERQRKSALGSPRYEVPRVRRNSFPNGPAMSSLRNVP
ncbi:hypothetical protein Z043_124057 [Scleropages formosus]|uniref:Galactose-3-O-sulfotransferase 2-like n=1 Tax=Scleropages formosus TaxID=113540 RepID=A0A0P7TKJ0_SCLFO|nr:hypothetical protein Z043_124057 [Scleropages formosus]